jgi:hypothetical protein
MARRRCIGLPYFLAMPRARTPAEIPLPLLMETLSAPASSRRRASSTLAHAAAHGQRHEAHFRGATDDVEDGVAVLVAGGDVEEGNSSAPAAS